MVNNKETYRYYMLLNDSRSTSKVKRYIAQEMSKGFREQIISEWF